MPQHRICIGCGIIIERPFWLCQSCEELYGVVGKPYSKWPRYLKDLVNEAQRFEYRAKGTYPVAPEELDDWWLETDEGGVLMRRRSAGLDRELTDADLLQYAPYDDEQSNREYRRVNGIPERENM